MSPEHSNMSKISTAICRSFFLWWHLGIGPMIGSGPMQARMGPAMPGRTRSVARPLPALSKP